MDKRPPVSTEAFDRTSAANKALNKANELETLFLRNKMPGLQEMKWVTEEDDAVAADPELKALVTSVGDGTLDGGVIRIIVQNGGPDVNGQQVTLTSVIMPRELVQTSSPELQRQQRQQEKFSKGLLPRWSILS